MLNLTPSADPIRPPFIDHFKLLQMIFLHKTTSPNSPFWLLHFESLTLARLILNPGGPHVLHIGNGTEPNDTANAEFFQAIEFMNEGFTKDLTIINRPDPTLASRMNVTLTPLHGTGFAIIKNTLPAMAVGFTEATGPIGPVWQETPNPLSRDFQLTTLLAMAQLQTEVRLETITPHASFPSLWLERPDSLASTS